MAARALRFQHGVFFHVCGHPAASIRGALRTRRQRIRSGQGEGAELAGRAPVLEQAGGTVAAPAGQQE
ncbi:hypothetical protein G6F64_015655 [Rhizopus arrhizus]|uniref:Uncharacterized protein n=1 Tax=Rhizopus oryzae TaxID=64495 RepID=A0A9P6WQR6_RHIOR|nr:hypothetical protein G6F64_015655 [Rhizopus arrhizus]